MRVCYILLVSAATLLATASAAVSTATDFNLAKISEVVSARVESSNPIHYNNDGIPKRSLRVAATGGTDDKEQGDVDAEDDDDDDDDDDDGDKYLSEGQEERGGGTTIIQNLHSIRDRKDAWMLRQIAKGNSMEHTLDKLKVPYEIMNGQRVYSIYNKQYARYIKWAKYNRDHRASF